MKPSRVLLLVLTLALTAAVLTACGGDDDGGGSGEDPTELLRTALTEAQEMESAVVDISIEGAFEGDNGGDFSASISGPTVSGGDKGIGSADLDVSAEAKLPGLGALTGGGDDVSIDGGITVVDEKLFIEYDGKTYVADERTFDSIAPGLGRVLKAGTAANVDEAEADQFIESLSEVKNEGTEDVEGVETTHISGQLDAEGLDALAKEQGESISDLGLGELDPIEFDMYVGTEDNLMRRMEMSMHLNLPEEAKASGMQTMDFSLAVTLSDVNEPQTIEAPKGAQPIQELLENLSGSLGLLGLGLTPGGSGIPGLGDSPQDAPSDDAGPSDDSGGGDDSGSGGKGGGNAPAGTPQEIAECLQKAGQDPEEIEACLTG